MSLRRIATVGAVLLASTVLVGCIQLPPQAPTDTTAPPSEPASSAPATSEQPSEPAESSEAPESGETTGGSGPFTVDDGLGDTWTYTVVGYELPAPLASGTPPAGTIAASLVIDATHDEGTASWSTCFDISITTDAGTFTTRDEASLALVGVVDTFGNSESFTEGQAIIAVPDDTTSGTFTVSSRFGDDTQTFPFTP